MKLLLHFAALSAVIVIAYSFAFKPPKKTTTTTTTTTTPTTTTKNTNDCCEHIIRFPHDKSRLIDRPYGQFPEDNALTLPPGFSNRPYLGFGPVHPVVKVTSFCFESKCAKSFFIVYYDEHFNILHSNAHEIAHKTDLTKKCFEDFYSAGCITHVKYIRIFVKPHIVLLDPDREQFYPSEKKECPHLVLQNLEVYGCEHEKPHIIW